MKYLVVCVEEDGHVATFGFDRLADAQSFMRSVIRSCFNWTVKLYKAM